MNDDELLPRAEEVAAPARDPVGSPAMKLDDLTAVERLALGGLVRLMLRADGSFSEEEEGCVNTIGDELGGRDTLWRAISDSAQAFPEDGAARDAAQRIERPEARELFLAVLASIAAADAVSPAEKGMIDALRAGWSGRADF